MQHNDMEWLKKASQAWVDQNDILGQQICELIKERNRLIEENKITFSKEKKHQISEIDKQIEKLFKQMECIELPIKLVDKENNRD